jgi:hypothetical protein
MNILQSIVIHAFQVIANLPTYLPTYLPLFVQIHLERRLLDPVQQRALGISTDIQRQRLLPQTLANIYYYSAFDIWTLLDVLCEVSSAIGRLVGIGR